MRPPRCPLRFCLGGRSHGGCSSPRSVPPLPPLGLGGQSPTPPSALFLPSLLRFYECGVAVRTSKRRLRFRLLSFLGGGTRLRPPALMEGGENHSESRVVPLLINLGGGQWGAEPPAASCSVFHSGGASGGDPKAPPNPSALLGGGSTGWSPNLCFSPLCFTSGQNSQPDPQPPPIPPYPAPIPPPIPALLSFWGGGRRSVFNPFFTLFLTSPPPPQPTSRCRSRAISWTRCCSWSCSGTKRPNWFGNTTRRGAKRDPPPRNALTDAPPPSGAAAASNASTVEEPPPLPPLPKAGATGGASRAAGAAPGGASVVEEGAAEVEEEVRTPTIRPVGVGGGGVGGMAPSLWSSVVLEPPLPTPKIRLFA